jgi:hypothetical protein
VDENVWPPFILLYPVGLAKLLASRLSQILGMVYRVRRSIIATVPHTLSSLESSCYSDLAFFMSSGKTNYTGGFSASIGIFIGHCFSSDMLAMDSMHPRAHVDWLCAGTLSNPSSKRIAQ